MTYPNDEVGRVALPVPVDVQNWAPPIAPPFVKSTTVRTYIIDPANLNRDQRYAQISTYEPKRLRLVVQAIDAAVALTMEQPNTSPDTSSATVANAGLYLANGFVYEFFGPDAFWLNALTTVTRVTVVKEYS